MKKGTPGSGEVCRVCLWQDDIQLFNDADSVGGLRNVSLSQARENYAKFGACALNMSRYAREPREYEVIDINRDNLRTITDVYKALKEYDKNSQVTLNKFADEISLRLSDSMVIHVWDDYLLEPNGKHQHLSLNEVYAFLLGVLNNPGAYLETLLPTQLYQRSEPQKPISFREHPFRFAGLLAFIVMSYVLLFLAFYFGDATRSEWGMFAVFLLVGLTCVLMIIASRFVQHLRFKRGGIGIGELAILQKFEALEIPCADHLELHDAIYWDTLYFDILSLCRSFQWVPEKMPYPLDFCDSLIHELQNIMNILKEDSAKDEKLYEFCETAVAVLEIVSARYDTHGNLKQSE